MRKPARLPALAAALTLGLASPIAALAQSPAPTQAPAGAPATPATPAPGATAQAPGAAPATPAAPGSAPTAGANGAAPAAGTSAPAAGAPGAAPEANGAATPPPGDATPPPDANAAANATVVGAGPTPGTETVSNPYGLGALWKNGDFVARGTLIILVIMSLGTWYIMITKFWEQARLLASARIARKNFWTTSSVRDGIQRLKPASPFRYIAETGLAATEHHDGTMHDAIDLHTWVTMSIQRAVDAISSRLQGGLAFLATVGSTAPFVGLFGTVWGIYHALTAIGIAGQASIDKVAGPVGEALIMTAIGLATAVPAVLGYNWLVRRNKAAMEQARNFASDVHSVLISGTRVAAAGQTVTPAPAVARVA
jgi:biopolymer transport protein ExbB